MRRYHLDDFYDEVSNELITIIQLLAVSNDWQKSEALYERLDKTRQLFHEISDEILKDYESEKAEPACEG